MLYISSIAIALIFVSIWLAQLICFKLHLNWANTSLEPKNQDNPPGVTFIHPMKGIDYELDVNVESWVSQDYKGKIQHIFSFQEEADPAIAIVEYIKAKYPHIDTHITINPILPKLSGKSSNMVNGLKLAKHDFVVFADSDIRVKNSFVAQMTKLSRENCVVSCAQMNIGGKDFLTRFFAYFQNNGTDFLWLFCTKIGMSAGLVGAAFAIKKELIKKIGGLEQFGNSLLEDYSFGKAVVRNGYKIVTGPFVECFMGKVDKEKLSSYAARCAVGMITYDPVSTIQLIVFLCWYWLLLITSIILHDKILFITAISVFMIRTLVGVVQQILTKNKFRFADIIMPIMSDLYETSSFLCALFSSHIVWRGVRYKVGRAGEIKVD